MFKRIFRLCLAIFSLVSFYIFSENLVSISEKPVVFIVASYNNAPWVEKNLNSLFSQNYKNFRVIYLNDCSKDSTDKFVTDFLIEKGIDYQIINFDDKGLSIPEATKLFLDSVNRERHVFTLVNNYRNVGALANHYRASHSCDDFEILVTVDGDDWLAHNDVLKEVNEAYSSSVVWFTHGTFVGNNGFQDFRGPVPKHIIENNDWRGWYNLSHLRTYYAWLFKKVKLDDFLYGKDFYKAAPDLAIMFPIAEMAAERHAHISRVNYVYNMSNPINEFRDKGNLQSNMDRHIRSRPRYERLEHGLFE